MAKHITVKEKKSPRNYPEFPESDERLPWIEDELENYQDPHLRSGLQLARELIPDEIWRSDTCFIAGGFAAHLAGVTNESSDIDIFCTSATTFDKVEALVLNHPGNADHLTLGANLIVTKPSTARAGYGSILKFEYCHQKFDLVDCSERPHIAGAYGSIYSLLNSFDLSWSMVGIDLYREIIVANRLAFSGCPHVKQINADVYPQRTYHRLNKYTRRIKRQQDLARVELLKAISLERATGKC